MFDNLVLNRIMTQDIKWFSCDDYAQLKSISKKYRYINFIKIIKANHVLHRMKLFDGIIAGIRSNFLIDKNDKLLILTQDKRSEFFWDFIFATNSKGTQALIKLFLDQDYIELETVENVSI